MILDPPKPRRRPLGRFLWPLVITAVALIAIAVAGAGRDTRADLEYLDQLHDQVVDLSVGGDSFRDVASRLSSIDRVEFVSIIDALRADLSVGMVLVESGPPSDSLVAVNALYRQTLEAWSTGVSAFGASVLVAADDPTNEVAVDNVANALAELRAGDELYLALLSELAEEDVPDPVAPMPEVSLMPGEGGLASLSVAYVEAARSPNSNLALRPGLGLAQIVSDPSWIVDPDDQVVVPATESIVFTVVVTNSGNVASGPERLVLTVTGGSEDVMSSVAVDPLEPNAQTAIIFDPVAVQPGGLYEVRASLEMTGIDADFEDNDLSVVFKVGEAVSQDEEEAQ